jgi:8-oxo-dGTP diphosphatase
MSGSNPTFILGVGAVIWNGRDEVLLVRRARPPRAGEWSIPGGKIESGETIHDALRREVREETGIEVEIGALAGATDLQENNCHYVLVDFTARHLSGELRAGSDAAEARWVAPRDLNRFELWTETRRIIEKSAEQLAKKHA